jgi:nucleoside-diphosphate-sugar epimerase
MNLLITGGAGRLGREVSRLIIKDNHEVSIFDLPQVLEQASLPEGCVKVPGDIREHDQVSNACENIDGVIHLAAILPPGSEVNKDRTFSVNVEGTKNLVKCIRNLVEVPIIFTSSISTYGVTAGDTIPINEKADLIPHNNYSESKIVSEEIVQNSGIPFTVLRIAPITVADLVELPEVIPYRSDQRVEFIHVSDAASALYSAFKNQKARGNTYNVAGGPTWQMLGSEYVTKYYSALGVEVEPNFSETYTAIDWYDTSRGRFLGYQNINFNMLLEELKIVAERLGLI